MTTNAGIHDTPPAPGTGIHGGSTGLEDVLATFSRGPVLAAALTDMYGVTPGVLIQPGMRLPASGRDGKIVDALVDLSSGVVWRFRYTPIQGVQNPWTFVGGPGLRGEVDAVESTGSNTWTDLTTIGPRVYAPFAGDFDIAYGYQASGFTGNNNVAQVIPWDMTSSVAFGNSLNIETDATGGNTNLDSSKTVRATGIAAGDEIRLRYQLYGDVGPVSFANRWMSVTPIRCAGG